MSEAQSFGQWLRHRRRELDLTQDELARQIGCAPITIRKIEGDQMRPSKQLAELLIERLRTPPEEHEAWIRYARGGKPVELVAIPIPKHNLPQPLSSFIGREREMAEVKRLMGTSRLVTLTGAGGSGKTRLALQVAGSLLDVFRDGVWWVELAALTQPSLVSRTLLKTFGLPEVPDQETVDTLANYLRNKQLLLVLDNCEHLVEVCASLADRILEKAPNLRILVTTREPLAIPGETVNHVNPLSLPKWDETSTECSIWSEAVYLFVERAQAVNPDFMLDPQTVSAVVQICNRLDGIPLALELAAARVRILSVADIAARLDDRFLLLTSGNRAALPRHQTLRAAIDWSYELLSEEEKALFHGLSIFAGGFTMEAAEQVCSNKNLAAGEVMPVLCCLADRSLIEVMQTGGEDRYRMLETIRMYAREKLQASGDELHIRNRHLKYFTQWVEEVESKLRGPEQIKWWDWMETEHNNIRSALEWSLEGGDVQMGLRLAGAAYWFWDPRDHMKEGLKWLKETLAANPPGDRTKARAKALLAAGVLACFDLSTNDPFNDWFQEGLDISREQGDHWWIAYALAMQGWYLLYNTQPSAAEEKFQEAMANSRLVEERWLTAFVLRGLGSALERLDYAAARPVLEKSVAIWREEGVLEGLADALNQLGTLAHGQGQEEQAIRYYEESLGLFRTIGSKTNIAMVLDNLGESAQANGQNERAAKSFKEAILLEQEISYYHGIAWSLSGLGGVAGEQHRPRKAARLLGAAQAWRESVGEDLSAWPYVLNDYTRWEKTARDQLGEAAFTTTFAEGRAMSLEEAVRYALEDREDEDSKAGSPSR